MDDEAEVTPVCLDHDVVGAVVRIGVVLAAELDLQIENGAVRAYRTKLKVSFKYEDA